MKFQYFHKIIVHRHEAKIKYRRCETSGCGEAVKFLPSVLFFENTRLGAINASADSCLYVKIAQAGRHLENSLMHPLHGCLRSLNV